MKTTLFVCIALWALLDVAGCAPRDVRGHDEIPMSQERTYEVEGEILKIGFEDLSKTRKQENKYTLVTLKVLSSQNLHDAELSIAVEEVSLKRRSKDGDAEWKVGETHSFKIGVDQVERPRYFYWLD